MWVHDLLLLIIFKRWLGQSLNPPPCKRQWILHFSSSRIRNQKYLFLRQTKSNPNTNKQQQERSSYQTRGETKEKNIEKFEKRSNPYFLQSHHQQHPLNNLFKWNTFLRQTKSKNRLLRQTRKDELLSVTFCTVLSLFSPIFLTFFEKERDKSTVPISKKRHFLKKQRKRDVHLI